MSFFAPPPAIGLYGIDFTSAPRPAKPIRVAGGCWEADGALRLTSLTALADWAAFERWLVRPGPWLAALDGPLGLPRSAVSSLGWPTRDWATMVRHCATLDKTAFRAELDALRHRRPPGARHDHRAGDALAGSHSPVKLVNPPMGLMFLAAAPRLLHAGVSLAGQHEGAPDRVVREAYPGYLARQLIGRASYKSEDRRRHDPARRTRRATIAAHLQAGVADWPVLRLSPQQEAALVEDGRGDTLDACLALLQAGQAARAGGPRYGMPADVDPLEGWIIGVSRPDGS